MGSIADKLTYLNGTKTAIKNAIVAKGVTVSDTDTFRDYATKIAEISGGGGEYETLYGANITNILGRVDENGVYQIPTQPFTLDMSAVKSLPQNGWEYLFYNNIALTGELKIGLEGDLARVSAMLYAFTNCSNLTGVDLSSLTSVTGESAMLYAFTNCSNLTGVDLSSLTTVSSTNAMASCFRECGKLTTVDLSSLTTISGAYAMEYTFYDTGLTTVDLSSLTTVDGAYTMNGCFTNCSNLTGVDLSSLTTVSSTGVLTGLFYNCASLTSMSFPALKEILPATTQDQFQDMFGQCTALTEIHFPSNMQERVEQLEGYDMQFGATNATIYFDLPSTATEG